MSEFQLSGGALLLVLLVGIILYVVLRKARSFLRFLPTTKRRRALAKKARPVVEILIITGFVIAGVQIVFRGAPLYSALVLALFLVGMFGLSWFMIRDLVAGMFLKASEICQPGDLIEVDGLRGLVKDLGYRVVALDTLDGSQAFVPYSRITRESLVRMPATDGAFRHAFTVTVPEDVEPHEVRRAIRHAALNSHWSSIVREPGIDLDGHGGFSVTVFSLAPDLGTLIERTVKEEVLLVADRR